MRGSFGLMSCGKARDVQGENPMMGERAGFKRNEVLEILERMRFEG